MATEGVPYEALTKDETGNRYGHLIVVRRIEQEKPGVYWLCKCDCGNETSVRGTSLRAGDTRTCGCHMGKAKDETGKRYGKLIVLERAKVKANRRGWFWLCQCDCGKQHIANGADLRKGVVSSCGCITRLAKGQAKLNDALRAYRRNADMRGLEWELSEQQFADLTQQPCHYCGSQPANKSTAGRHFGDYVYSGLDRKDPEMGYIPDNVVPCCKRCNYAKNDSSYMEFLTYLDRLVAYRQSRRIDGN